MMSAKNTGIFSWGVGVAIVAITLLSLLSHIAWHPYLELTSHFKIQYFLISLFGLIVILLLRSKRWVWIALFCLAIQLIEILPWYFPSSGSTTSTQSNLRILLSNVYVRNQNPDKLLNLIKSEQPNLVVIQEKTPAWIEAINSLKPQFPHFFQAPEDIAIFSRIPLENPTIFGGENSSSIGLTLTIAGQKIAVVATHPLPPKPDLTEFRNAELDWVTNYINQQNNPVILVGDLNTTMWSPYYKQLEDKTGLKNARQGFGILPTWPAPTPYASTHPFLAFFKPLLFIPIDHYLVSPEIQVRSLRPGSNIDSDHLPLIADLLIQPVK
ncbi:MAG: endonuclease/exonuclease/phosphatase family protein [Leptolyngbyaceae cyanobacterium bins.302]|nr:endonuclease/exonuclease/phosphatase family protein [Leptolyngbyaceae cyanobacterium bins.302]